jgi:DNA invertase Pin-like site-specific DNA recombinase
MSSNFANGKHAPVIQVIALARVSTKRQDNLSPRAQIEAIRKWAKDRGYEVVKEFTEVVSGRRQDRDGLTEAMALTCEIQGMLVVYDATRLFRNTLLSLQAFSVLASHGAYFASVTENVMDTRDDTPASRFTRTLFSALGQLQSDQQGAKIAYQNMLTVREKGHRTNGVQPAGWKLDENGRRIPCELELASIEAAKKALVEVKFVRGRYSKAARLLNERGVPTISEIRARRNNRENRKATLWTGRAVQWVNTEDRARWVRKKRSDAAKAWRVKEGV